MARSLLNALPRLRMNHMPRPLAELFYPRLYPTEISQVWFYRLVALFCDGFDASRSILDDQIQSPARDAGYCKLWPTRGKNCETGGVLDLWKRLVVQSFDGCAVRCALREVFIRRVRRFALCFNHHNAGPKPTKRWIRTNGDKNWKWVEEVSYRETRDYVKKVLGNFWSYQMIWEGRWTESPLHYSRLYCLPLAISVKNTEWTK